MSAFGETFKNEKSRFYDKEKYSYIRDMDSVNLILL